MFALIIAVAMASTPSTDAIDAAERQYQAALEEYGRCLAREAIRLGGDTRDDAALVMDAAAAACLEGEADVAVAGVGRAAEIAAFVADGGRWESNFDEEGDLRRLRGRAALELLERRRRIGR